MLVRALLPFALALTACAGDVAGDGPSTLHARGLLVAPLEPVQLALHTGATGVRLRPEFSPQDANLRICTLADDAPEDGIREACVDSVAWGVRTPLTGAIESLRIEADRPITLDLTAEFFPRGDEIALHLPRVPAAPSEGACLDNACRVLLELTPVHTGTLTARAVIDGYEAELAVLSGRILARSETATGVPYRVADRAIGASPLEVSAQLDQGAEFAVVFGRVVGTGVDALRDSTLRISWPGA